jgi:hypothetical protein
MPGWQKTLNEALGQTLQQLEVVKLAIGSSVTLWKTSDKALRRSQPSPNERRNSYMPMGHLGRVALREQCDVITCSIARQRLGKHVTIPSPLLRNGHHNI